jgi:DNA-binding transcriptional ArsR family regulator
MDPLSAKFAALADPTRRAILARLAQGNANVTDLAEPFDMSLPAVSKHIKVLEQAGLISRSREAQRRPCKLEPRALKSLDDWLEEYRRLWEDRLDRLEDFLRDMQAKEKAGAKSLAAPAKTFPAEPQAPPRTLAKASPKTRSAKAPTPARTPKEKNNVRRRKKPR